MNRLFKNLKRLQQLPSQTGLYLRIPAVVESPSHKARSTLWGVPVDGVDFLAAHVADEERGVVGGQAGPRCKIAPVTAHTFEADEALEFAVGDADTEEVGVFGEGRIEVNVLAVMRPGGIAHRQAD